MRLVSISENGSLRPGIEVSDAIADLQEVAQAAGWDEQSRAGLRSGRTVVELGREKLNELAKAAEQHVEGLRLNGGARLSSETKLGPPVPDPGKIICLGLNYSDHAAEAGLQAPAAPMFFAKWSNSLIGPTDDIIPPVDAAEQVDYEAELAVVIGKRGRHIKEAEALDHVAGAMAFNDVSARDLQMANTLWTGGKAIDTFGPCGPALVIGDALGDLQALAVTTRVNGEVVQDGNTGSMIFGVAKTIAFLSKIMTLEPGDIIATGTPAGVGNSRDPKLFLHSGDVVEVEIENIGTLRNRVADPA